MWGVEAYMGMGECHIKGEAYGTGYESENGKQYIYKKDRADFKEQSSG